MEIMRERKKFKEKVMVLFKIMTNMMVLIFSTVSCPTLFRMLTCSIFTLYHRFSELINVNESGTAEDFANLVKNPYFRSLENDYVKLVKKLEKIEGVEQEVDLNALPTEERNGF